MADKDPTLGDAVEDAYYASGGVRTGTAFNETLVSQREQAQKMGAPASATYEPRRARSEPLFSFVDDWAGRIPRVVHGILFSVAFLVSVGYSLHLGESVGFSLFMGLIAIGLTVIAFQLLIFVVKLLLLAACLAIIGAVAWGLYWLYTQFF